ncbi:MAG: DUF86 domain-containing protein [Synergistaceae bacterium]|nr:DUF86 domain-containing protein [Synergistaceae bacterium]MBR0079282.1 DUF86 domain-containing protein [Synergistaceae bacterium]MBR0253054.1 DUF86 domain-containing protein [Synergistaceae bacterium]
MNDKDRALIKRMIGYCDDIYDLLEKFDYSFQKYLTKIEFQYSCGMCLIQIGELAGKISDETVKANPQIAWRAIKAMRNIHAHDYGNVDHSIVWDSIENDVPDLRQKLLKLLNA